MSREARINFIDKLASATETRRDMLYSSGIDKNRDGSRFNSITIIFNLEWPKNNHYTDDFSNLQNSHQKFAIATTVFRTKDYLERQLSEEISIMDIRPGCIKVRYKLSKNIRIETVYKALINLEKLKSNFYISSVNGHVNGRAVKV